MSKPPRGIARFDSAAAMVQALAASMTGKPFASPSQSPALDALMPAINQLPRIAREWAYAFGGMTESIGPRHARQLDIEKIAEWIVGLYPDGPFRAAFVGSSNGALVHVAAALGVPWLPQTFLCPVRAPLSDPDDGRRAFEQGRRVTDALLEADDRIAVHHMFDPNQDRLMLQTMRYFRLKYRALPLAYREFLLRNLPPGGTLYIVACKRTWPVTRMSERAVFQFGATGGATEHEYLHGGPRVRDYLARYGSARSRWDPPRPDDIAPEAEWGFDTALIDELLSIGARMNWRIVEIRFREPEAASFVAANIYRDWYRDEGIEPRRLIVDSFLLMDPWTTLRLHALPFWLLFCIERSADALQRFLAEQPPFDEIDLMLFSHGTESIGLESITRWRTLIDSATRAGRFLGVDEARYPRDFATFTRFHDALSRLAPRYEPPQPLSPERFETLLQAHGPAYDVHCLERAHTLP